MTSDHVSGLVFLFYCPQTFDKTFEFLLYKLKQIYYNTHARKNVILATSKLPFTIASWGCFGGREQRNRPPKQSHNAM